MRVLITGGAGFIGRHLVRRLVADPSHEVIVLDNLRRAERPRESGFQFIDGDIRDRVLLSAVMAGVDVVFHLAAQSNVIGAVSDLDYSFSTNVIGTFNVLSEARLAGVKKVVFTSSREVYGDVERLPVAETARLAPKNAYGASKLAGEEYCRVFSKAGLAVSILRLANVYGPGDEDRVIPIFLDNALRQAPLILYGGQQVLDFVWIEPVVDGLVRAIALKPEVGPVNIGSGVGTRIRELAEMILNHTRSTGGIRVVAARKVEVSAFVADVRKALRFGLVHSAGKSLEHLDRMIDSKRAEFLKSPISHDLPLTAQTDPAFRGPIG
jgi:UDP-glucose 4-epimerase